jgi:hypothetical protein
MYSDNSEHIMYACMCILLPFKYILSHNMTSEEPAVMADVSQLGAFSYHCNIDTVSSSKHTEAYEIGLEGLRDR